MKSLFRLLELLALAGVVYIAARPAGQLPPPGPLLDPAAGIWAVARKADLPAREELKIPSLERPVQVVFDDRAVPHIFATTEEDATRALGYVVARDRLFQLEMQTRATEGRLSELFGRALLPLDREQRALGLAASADRAFQQHPPDSRSKRLVEAYAQGVNAWIDHLSRADLPLEYRLLNRKPMRWEPRYTFLLLRRMGYTLAYQTEELIRKRAAEKVGVVAAAALFPVNSPVQEPIQSGRRKYPAYDWQRIPAPATNPPRSSQQPMAPSLLRQAPSGQGIGSNNWAVAPARSANGHALLAGDPHLDLTLPSIWYEAHLVVTGGSAPLDVYGVTIPGSPAIVIGFNRDVAWTLTNTEADVLDYYAETLNDPSRPTAYRLDGDWAPLSRRIEVFKGPQGETLATDTNYATHRGPLLDPHGSPLSMRWTVLETNVELDALLAAEQATGTRDLLTRTEGFRAPAQNVAVADRHGDIAIRSTGRFPLRPAGQNPSEIQDGRTRKADWLGDRPLSRYPQELNPARGFVSSANQQPLDPRADAEYFGVDWGSPWRAIRINELLGKDSAMTVERMRAIQTDIGSARADFFVPYFVKAGQAGPGSNDSLLRRAVAVLAGWDRRYEANSRAATLFETAMGRLTALTWDELEGLGGRRVATPNDVILAELLQDPTNTWWDRRSTADHVETRDEILRQSLIEAVALGEKLHGALESDGWNWGLVQHTNLYHLLRIPALSALGLPPPGSRETISPISVSGTNGSSWRMVVDLGPQVRGWGNYPGGQSGNPVSARYLDRIRRWTAGELDTLRTPRTPDEPALPITSRLNLLPEGN